MTVFTRYADREVCTSGARDLSLSHSPLGPSPTTAWQASGVAIHHLPQAGRPEGWGRSVGGRAAGSDAPPLLEVPRCSRAALAGGSWGMSVGSVSGAFWGPGQAGPGQRWEGQVLQLSPSHLQRCVKAIPRAQKMRCACGQASAAADMATSVPTATLVSVGPGGVGCWTVWWETREIRQGGRLDWVGLGGWVW